MTQPYGLEAKALIYYDIRHDRFYLVSEDGKRQINLPADVRLDYLVSGAGLKQGCIDLEAPE